MAERWDRERVPTCQGPCRLRGRPPGSLTTQPVQGLLRVGVPVAALPDVAGLQLHRHLHRGHRRIARLQVDVWEEGQCSRARLVLDLVAPSCVGPQIEENSL